MSRTNEWEFQGDVLNWANSFLSTHDVDFDKATQEFPNSQGTRSDVIIWLNHRARIAALAMELKTPTTLLSDRTFQQDAILKAQSVAAPYIALWNMRMLVLYKTPAAPRKGFLPTDLVREIGTLDAVSGVEDWLKLEVQTALRDLCHSLLRHLHDLTTLIALGDTVVDATVFVQVLTDRVRNLRPLLEHDVNQALAGAREVRNEIRKWVKEQGLDQFVDDINESLAAQLAYRLVGQTLFYYAFRRQEPSLPKLSLDTGTPLSEQLRVYWDEVRTYDYEALYEESPLERIPCRMRASSN